MTLISRACGFCGTPLDVEPRDVTGAVERIEVECPKCGACWRVTLTVAPARTAAAKARIATHSH